MKKLPSLILLLFHFWGLSAQITMTLDEVVEQIRNGNDISGVKVKQIPLNLAFDLKPAFEIYDTAIGVRPHLSLNSGYGLTARYVFNK